MDPGHTGYIQTFGFHNKELSEQLSNYLLCRKDALFSNRTGKEH
jgi:hypothetical protein